MTEAPQERWIEAEIPRKLGFFNEWGKWRYKVIKGGRGKGASRSIATVLAARGVQKPIRWFCARETQKSQRLSSMQLVEDAINRLNLQREYTIVPSDKVIRGNRVWPDGRRTMFPFEGIREMSVDSIKSLEDFDGIWLAEAHELSKESWMKITPTFRKDGWACSTCWKGYPSRLPPMKCECGGSLIKDDAEIWCDFNPEFEEDFINQWCTEHADDPRAKIVHANYYDNPWFPDVLRADMERDKATDPETYKYVWLGTPRNNVVGAVYAKELAKAHEDGRFVATPGIGVDRMKPVDTYWDLGHDDNTAIWFAQLVSGWVNILDYYDNSFESMEHYIGVLRARGYTLGTCWLPWDGASARTHHKLTGDPLRSPEQVLRGYGFEVRLSADIGVGRGISAVRTIFPQLRFDDAKCASGIRHLRRYQWGEKPKSGNVVTKPKHDDESHAADALRILAANIREQDEPEIPAHLPMPRPGTLYGWTG